MTERLGPGPLKIFLFYLLLIMLIVGPVVVLMVAAFTGPEPYLLKQEEIKDKWINKRLRYQDYTVELYETKSNEEAKKLSKRLFNATDATNRVKTINIFRYKTRDQGDAGIIFPIQEFVVRVEAADRETVDKALIKLPYIEENPQKNQLYELADKNISLVLIAIGVYTVFLTLFIARAGSAVATIRAPPKGSPASAHTLQNNLLSLDKKGIPFTVTRLANNRLRCSWRIADKRWSNLLSTGKLRVNHIIDLEFDDGNRVVRSITTNKAVRWQRGILKFFAIFNWSRGINFYALQAERQYGVYFEDGDWSIEPDYSYTLNVNQIREPIVRLIVDSGWNYRPVLSFFFLFR